MALIIILILFIWTMIGAVCLKVYEDNSIMVAHSGREFPYFNPIWIYKNYDVNFIGVIILTIVFNLACPPISMLYWLIQLIMWICTVGRE